MQNTFLIIHDKNWRFTMTRHTEAFKFEGSSRFIPAEQFSVAFEIESHKVLLK